MRTSRGRAKSRNTFLLDLRDFFEVEGPTTRFRRALTSLVSWSALEALQTFEVAGLESWEEVDGDIFSSSFCKGRLSSDEEIKRKFDCLVLGVGDVFRE